MAVGTVIQPWSMHFRIQATRRLRIQMEMHPMHAVYMRVLALLEIQFALLVQQAKKTREAATMVSWLGLTSRWYMDILYAV